MAVNFDVVNDEEPQQRPEDYFLADYSDEPGRIELENAMEIVLQRRNR